MLFVSGIEGLGGSNIHWYILDDKEPLIASVNQAWFRIYKLRRSPMFFGRGTTHRFNAPGSEFGVMYMGGDEHCAFIETWARRPAAESSRRPRCGSVDGLESC